MNNSSANNNFCNITKSLIERLNLMLTTMSISDSVIYYSLDILLSNSDSKIICNYIYLLLLLNQLQYLIVSKILDYAIGNEIKIYLESN